MSKLPFGFEAKDGYTCIIVKERQLVVLTSDKIVCACRYEAEDGTFADAMFRFSGRTEGTIRLSMLQLSDPQEFKLALLKNFKPDSLTTIPLTTVITETADSKLITNTLNSLIRYLKELYADCHIYTSVRPGIGDVTTLEDRTDTSEILMDVKDFSIWNGGNQVLMTWWKDGNYEHKQLPFSKSIQEFKHKQFQLTDSDKQLSDGYGVYPDLLEKGIAKLIKFYQFTGGMMAGWCIVASYYKDIMREEIKIPPVYLYGKTKAGKSSCAKVMHAMFGIYEDYASTEFKGNGIVGATTVWIDRLFGGNEGVHAIPVILDEAEKKEAYAEASAIQKMILAIYDGTGRGQGTRSQSGTHKTHYVTTAIVAGIDLPEQSEALNRCFILNMGVIDHEHRLEYDEVLTNMLKELSAFVFTARKVISYKHIIKRFYEIRKEVFTKMQSLGMTNRETASIAIVKAGYELLVENNLIPKDTIPEYKWYSQVETMSARAKNIDVSEQLLRMAMDVSGRKIGFIEWSDFITYQDFSYLPQPYYRLTIKTSKEGENRVAFKMLAEYYRQETQKPMDAIKSYQALLNHRLLVRDSKGEDTYPCQAWNENVIIRESDKKRYSIATGNHLVGKVSRCMVFEIPYEADESNDEARDEAEAPPPAELADTTQETMPF
jgi:hypothetical protein